MLKLNKKKINWIEWTLNTHNNNKYRYKKKLHSRKYPWTTFLSLFYFNMLIVVIFNELILIFMFLYYTAFNFYGISCGKFAHFSVCKSGEDWSVNWLTVQMIFLCFLTKLFNLSLFTSLTKDVKKGCIMDLKWVILVLN